MQSRRSTDRLNAPLGEKEKSSSHRRFSLALALAAFLLSFTGCGYHVAGRASKLPSEWKEIAVPAFKNETMRYRIEQRLTAAVIREFISRTKYRIVQDQAGADAVLHGEVLSIETAPVIFDSTTGQVTTQLVTLHVRVQLIDNRSQKPVYHNNDMVFRDEYQISSDVQSFFEEQNPAVDRMARAFASQLVSNVLENF